MNQSPLKRPDEAAVVGEPAEYLPGRRCRAEAGDVGEERVQRCLDHPIVDRPQELVPVERGPVRLEQQDGVEKRRQEARMKSVRRHVVEPGRGDVRQLDLRAQVAGVRALIRRNLPIGVKMRREKDGRPVHWGGHGKERDMELDKGTSPRVSQRRAMMLPWRVRIRNPLETVGQQLFGNPVFIVRRHQDVHVCHRTHVRQGVQTVGDRDAFQEGSLHTEVAADVQHGNGRRDQVGMPNPRRKVGREERPGPMRRDALAVRRCPAQQRTQTRPQDPVELSIVRGMSMPVNAHATRLRAGAARRLEQSRSQRDNGTVRRRNMRQRAVHERLDGAAFAKHAWRLEVDAASIEYPDFTISREVNGEMLVLDSRAELVHQLNPTASFVWQQAQSGSTAEEIASALAEQYDVDPKIAHRDVTATLARLKELNLVTGP